MTITIGRDAILVGGDAGFRAGCPYALSAVCVGAPTDTKSLDQGVTVRRGRGYTLRVSSTPPVHRQLLDRCRPLDGTSAIPAQRKACREYANRVNTLAPNTP